MDQCAKDGSSKLLHRCTLPLTGSGVIDMVITDLGVFEIDKAAGKMVLVELADGVTLDEIAGQDRGDLHGRRRPAREGRVARHSGAAKPNPEPVLFARIQAERRFRVSLRLPGMTPTHAASWQSRSLGTSPIAQTSSGSRKDAGRRIRAVAQHDHPRVERRQPVGHGDRRAAHGGPARRTGMQGPAGAGKKRNNDIGGRQRHGSSLRGDENIKRTNDPGNRNQGNRSQGWSIAGGPTPIFVL